jgi:hypothetical protein
VRRPSTSFERVPAGVVPNDHSRQIGAEYYVDRLVNRLIELRGRMQRMEAEEINLAELLFAGQIAFLARRPEA